MSKIGLIAANLDVQKNTAKSKQRCDTIGVRLTSIKYNVYKNIDITDELA